MPGGKGVRAGQIWRAPHLTKPDDITRGVSLHQVNQLTKHSLVPPNILVPRVDKVNNDKGQFATGFEMTQLKLNQVAKYLEGHVIPVHLLNVLGKVLDILTGNIDGEFMFGREFGDFRMFSSDHRPVVVHDWPPRQTRTDRVGADDR